VSGGLPLPQVERVRAIEKVCGVGEGGAAMKAAARSPPTAPALIFAAVTAFFFTRAGTGKFTEQAKDRTGATPAAWHFPL
jgi:hypothetical protein